ncbi:unnamed protein product [Orchesella dallaii]|uniref:Uncharacterized protein n=1 Tax=Orchesella dallaii TaxID=48710 RepID=A0ABP1PS65_9HEXA
MIPSLPPLEQAIGFEKRAMCYLKLAKEIGSGSNLTDCDSATLERNDLFEKAIADAKETLDRNDSSWNTHYILGQCFSLKNVLVPAIFHYKRALGIAPQLAQREIKMELKSCSMLAGLNSSTEKRTYYDYAYPQYWNLSSDLKQEIQETIAIICSPFHKQKSSSFNADTILREQDGIRLIWLLGKTIVLDEEIMEITSKEDMEIRCCYIYLITPICKNTKYKKAPWYNCNEGHLSALKLPEDGLQMYPENLIYELICEGYSALLKYEIGLRIVEQGLKTLPNHLSLLLLKAFLIHSLYASQNVRHAEVIQAHRDFLNVAPRDHPITSTNVVFLMYYVIASLCRRDLVARNAKQ